MRHLLSLSLTFTTILALASQCHAEIDAQNALIGLKVSHFIGRLRLLSSLGILFIDENGGW